MDIQGIEPWTSRMRSVRATTVPNAQYILGCHLNFHDEKTGHINENRLYIGISRMV